MKTILILLLLVATTLTTPLTFTQITFAQTTIDGFSPARIAAERRWEEQFRAVPDPKSAREHLRRLTIEPHIAGTKEDYDTAVYVRDQLRSYGLNADLREYEVWLNYPKSPGTLELITTKRQPLSTREAVVPGDPTSSNPKITPLFNGYSATGDVTAPVVYANYGLPGDYEELKKAGVDVKGKIVIVRYGNSFRGVKAKVAEDHGAVGCIIYSDPEDDGYMQGDVYPKGPWRPVASGQRGSVQYLFDYPGDPLTPGKPAIPGTPRLKPEEATDLTRIPVQPIAYDVAKTILSQLKGPVRPARGFQGGLPFAYHLGGTDDVKLRLKTDMDYKQRKIWDVVTRIDGNEEKDRWVILGNHRDAWVFGAVDPNSGSSAMLEVGRGFASLLKQGWKPRRTIILCSWDAEEYGLIGSTEWAEEFADELKEKAVAYLNLDVAVSGPHFGASSVPSLWKLIRAATRDIKDPKTGKTVYQQWQDHAHENRPESEQRPPEEAIGALGSGSDYTPFLQHLGIPSTDMGFNGDYGVYHSAYDSFYWMDHFGDPGFNYHVAAAQLWGTLAMRLADADGLSFDYTDYAKQIREFFTEAMRLARIRNLAGSLDDKSMTSAIDDFAKEAERIEKNRQEAVRDSDPERLTKINDAVIQAERQFIDARGLRGRAWYKHQIYAPGIYTGYAAQPLTDFRQALDDRNSTVAKESLERIVEAIKRVTRTLKSV
ncbi:MAG TPA: M28 family metallopeptidase [Pyrinomonadaceae bacterium]|jgi:N-acetylated-alpha-linked acidic dipeptidase|nr:M28 family metallopeptidase [Pyrinomonadaceae bacterium]